MESLNALNKLASRVDDEHLNSILSNVLLKLRPCFEKVWMLYSVFSTESYCFFVSLVV